MKFVITGMTNCIDQQARKEVHLATIVTDHCEVVGAVIIATIKVAEKENNLDGSIEVHRGM